MILYFKQHIEDGAARQEGRRNTREEVYAYDGVGHGDGGYDRK